MQSHQETYQDVEETLGHVPAFVREIPPQAVSGFWSKMKDFELAETAIPGRYKELIGLAVASTIPCGYCVTFHREAARLHGASEEEMREAVQMAAQTREGSAILNGSSQNIDEFQMEVREMMQHLRRQQAEAPTRAGPAR